MNPDRAAAVEERIAVPLRVASQHSTFRRKARKDFCIEGVLYPPSPV